MELVVGLRTRITLSRKTTGGAVNNGLAVGLAAIPSTNISRVRLEKMDRAVVLPPKTLALSAGAGV